MMGHRFLTESLAKDVGSEVTDWAGQESVECSHTVGSRYDLKVRLLTDLGIVLHVD